MYRTLSPIFVAGSALHLARYRSQEVNCSDTSAAAAGAFGAVAAGVAGAGVWLLAERRRERDTIAIVQLEQIAGLNKPRASSTTYATRCHDNRVSVKSTSRAAAAGSAGSGPDQLMASVRLALAEAGGPTPTRRLVVIKGPLLSRLSKADLARVAKQVEDAWPNAEVHGLSSAHEAAHLARAVHFHASLHQRPLSGPKPLLSGVVASVGGGDDVFICAADGCENQVPDAQVSIELVKGVELLAKQGPDGAAQYEWTVKKQVANAVRARAGFLGPRLKGHFALAGCGFDTGPDSGKPILSGSSSSSSSPLTLTRAVVLQRLEGEAAAEGQWLKLHRSGEGEDCPELTPSKLAWKRQRVAQCLALGVLIDMSFDPQATFEVANGSARCSASDVAVGVDAGVDAGGLVPLGLYLEERGRK